jgi:hypothetical protein
MDNIKFNTNDHLSFKDEANKKHGLRGHVQIYRENTITKEKALWYEDDNIIPISGYQWILMKMFGLYLDSSHNKSYEDISKDTTVVIPDLNNSGVYQLGVDPADYTTMDADISENHFIQGFMIGNGGSGEDSITTKNTNYSFTKLRNPIPFQQTQTSLSSDIAGQYLGMLRVGSSSFSKSYYIKKFDEQPHIYHSWWRDGQKWDYVDPVTQNDLGPDAVNGIGKTNRIETYAECKMSLNEDDCIAYFSHDGSTQTAVVNELGLVAYDTVPGVRSIIEQVYQRKIKEFLNIIFDNNLHDEDHNNEVITMAAEIYTVIEQLKQYNQSNINSFIETVDTIAGCKAESIDYLSFQNELTSDDNIAVEAFYNQNGSLVYTTDKFLDHMSDSAFSGLSTDEAQRIKLITYYTFNSIPLQSNWRILINYRIYAN